MASANIGGGNFKPGSVDGLKGTNSPAAPNGKTGLGALTGEEFRRALEQVGVQSPGKPGTGATALNGPAGAQASGASEKLKFSNHAIERMRSRGINFAPEQMQSIEAGVAKAAAKGSKDTLVLSGDAALIVSVKNNTVVTVMDRAGMKDNVFTNIDSTVVV